VGEEKMYLFFHNLIHLLLLRGETYRGGHGCGCILSLTLSTNHEEYKPVGMRDDLPALFDRGQGNGIDETTLGIPYNFLSKVIITIRGLNSYTT
jgi:hypothetical protein